MKKSERNPSIQCSVCGHWMRLHGRDTCHIIIDDHCYVLCMENEDGSCKPTTHIFKEAFEVIKTLPNL